MTWDDDSKAGYPLDFYYLAIKGRRPDIKMNQFFGLVMAEAEAQRYAKRMLGQLRRNEQVFVSALVEPEREILNQLYHRLDPATSIQEIRSKNLDEFRSAFPEYEFVDVPVVSDGTLQIYQLCPKNSDPSP